MQIIIYKMSTTYTTTWNPLPYF